MDPPQKMKSSSIFWSPTCHGQFTLEEIWPPTIRPIFGRPHIFAVVGVGGVGVTVVATKMKKKNSVNNDEEHRPL